MATFLNVDIDGETPSEFLWKHIVFSFLWIAGASVLFFRVDIIILNKTNIQIDWLEGTLPIALLLLAGIIMLTQQWYYNLALIVYPL